MTCIKCGGTNFHITYIAVGDVTPKANKFTRTATLGHDDPRRYPVGTIEYNVVHTEHLLKECKTCGYEFTDLTLDKK